MNGKRDVWRTKIQNKFENANPFSSITSTSLESTRNVYRDGVQCFSLQNFFWKLCCKFWPGPNRVVVVRSEKVKTRREHVRLLNVSWEIWFLQFFFNSVYFTMLSTVFRCWTSREFGHLSRDLLRVKDAGSKINLTPLFHNF